MRRLSSAFLSTVALPPRLPRHPSRHMVNRPHTAAHQIQPPPPDAQTHGQVRVRQHVNPLARRWSQPVELPSDWYARAFADAALPLAVDLGVAKGRFLLRMAAAHPHRNFLGLEIREPLVHQANRVAAERGLRNLFYVACNANVSLRDVVGGAPKGVLREVYVQFCDPWFKKRHAKRRMVNAPLASDVHEALKVRGTVFLQSDVLEVAEEMRAIFDEHEGFDRVAEVEWAGGWLKENPVGEKTEREIAVLNKGGDVYRALFVKTDTILDRSKG